MKPEAQARQQIDAVLAVAGWAVQEYDHVNLGAQRGIAIAEFPLSTGPTDYLLVVDRTAVGGVEAKKVGETLTGVEIQSTKYREGRPGVLPVARSPLPFAYETTGVETRFTNCLEPDPRSRPVFAFHQPETLAALAVGYLTLWYTGERHPVQEVQMTHAAHTTEALFADKDETVRALYQCLLEAMRALGPFQEEPKKTSVHFVTHVGFAGVHPRKTSLSLNLRLDHPIESERISKTERVSKHRYHNEVKLVSPDEVDKELLSWLSEAYMLG